MKVNDKWWTEPINKINKLIWKARKDHLTLTWKKEKVDAINRVMVLLRGKEMMLKAFWSGLFSLDTDNYSHHSEQLSN